MEQLDLKGYQKRLVEILKFFDGFCRSNDIKYTVIYGSLLGAVRHKGMIPWDGDVDVALTNEEFRKLKRAFNSYSGRYYLSYIPNHIYKGKNRSHDFPTIVAKLTDTKCSSGIFGIDVFIIDFLGDDYEYAKETVSAYNRIKSKQSYAISFHLPYLFYDHKFNMKGFFVLLLYPFLYLVSRIYSPIYVKQYLGFRKKRIDCFDSKSKYFTVEPCVYGNLVENNFYVEGGYVDLPFEDFKVMAVENYDTYLRCFYGDYMQLPPKEKQVPYPSTDALTSCTFDE